MITLLDELEEIKETFDKSFDSILKYHVQDDLIVNGNLQTWMDTFNENDFRSGARIEIQAYYLRMFKFGSYISKLLKSDGKKYEEAEIKMKNKVKKVFFKDGLLADGFTDEVDMTQRPNIFLAYYAYPDLLENKEWESAFDGALDKLWLEWGGLSSIDKENPLFREEYSGQDNQSYHRGDSWYYINNLAALCMHRVNPKKYGKYVTPIVNASKQEMLFSGFLGHSAEISSAKEKSSFGARCQAWSAATFIELMEELR